MFFSRQSTDWVDYWLGLVLEWFSCFLRSHGHDSEEALLRLRVRRGRLSRISGSLVTEVVVDGSRRSWTRRLMNQITGVHPKVEALR